jgi:hypothetical protein
MSNLEVYGPLIDALNASAIQTYFQGPDQLVVSRQTGLVLPNAGNSFWISNLDGKWYLATWVPVCYRVPVESDLVELCRRFMEIGDSAQYTVPSAMVEQFGLIELIDAEVDRVFGLEGDDDVD